MMLKIWKAPVWSKVISVGVLLLIGLISDHYISRKINSIMPNF